MKQDEEFAKKIVDKPIEDKQCTEMSERWNSGIKRTLLRVMS